MDAYTISSCREGGFIISLWGGSGIGSSEIVFAASDIEMALVFLEQKLTQKEEEKK